MRIWKACYLSHSVKTLLRGCPVSMLCVGDQTRFSTTYAYMRLDKAIAQPLLAFGLTCVCFVHRGFCLWKSVPVSVRYLFIHFQNIIWMTQAKSRKNLSSFKTGIEFVWQISMTNYIHDGGFIISVNRKYMDSSVSWVQNILYMTNDGYMLRVPILKKGTERRTADKIEFKWYNWLIS